MVEDVLENDAVDEVDGEFDGEVDRPEAIRWGRLLALLLLLPLFAGSFSYVKDIRPLWALSKAFPILSLPLVLVLFWQRRAPVTRQMLITILYMILVPSFTGMVSFHQDFFTGLTSQVKLLPLFFFFSFLALLYLLQPTLRELEVAFLTWIAITFAVLLFLWLFAPASWYTSQFKVGENPLLTTDSRGFRIRMPMYFGMIGIFYCYRRFFLRFQWAWLLPVAGMFSLLIFAVKTRSYVVGVALLLCINAFRFSRPKARIVLLALVPVALLGLSTVPLVGSLFSTSQAGGFDTRQVSIDKAMDFLGTSVTRWTIGVGSITPLNPSGMLVFFNHFFFLADLFWLGVVFEYGLIGAALFLAIPLRGLWISRRLKLVGPDLFLGSLQDYLLFAVVVSAIQAIILAPGELTIILALFVYQWDHLRWGEA